MQKIKRFIKDIPFKRVLICKTIQKGSKSWNSSQIWLFFKTYKCIFKTQNSWHFFCYTDTVCCLQDLFQLGWLGTRQAYYKINVAIAASCSKFLGQILYDFEGMLAYRIDIKGFLAVQNSSIGDLVTHSSLRTLLIEWPWRLVTFETFVQSDEKTWHDQKKLTKTNTKTKTMTKTKTFWEHLLRAILETCDIWDICSECESIW